MDKIEAIGKISCYLFNCDDQDVVDSWKLIRAKLRTASTQPQAKERSQGQPQGEPHQCPMCNYKWNQVSRLSEKSTQEGHNKEEKLPIAWNQGREAISTGNLCDGLVKKEAKG